MMEKRIMFASDVDSTSTSVFDNCMKPTVPAATKRHTPSRKSSIVRLSRLMR